MHRDRDDRRRARVRWTAWLAAGSVAVLLTVRALDDDVVEVLDASITALRAAETALDDAVVDIRAAAEAQGGRDTGSAQPGAMSAAARRAESAARAAGRASTEARTVLTRVRHMRMERSGTFAEAVATVRGLRDATRALMAAVEALRQGAKALRETGAVRAAHRALLAADATLDAAETVLQATEAALDDERFDPPDPAERTRGADSAQKTATAPGRSWIATLTGAESRRVDRCTALRAPSRPQERAPADPRRQARDTRTAAGSRPG